MTEISEHHPKPGEGRPLAEWENQLLAEQDALMWLIIPKLSLGLCDCENREACPGVQDDATALAIAIMAGGWRKGEVDMATWPCANFDAPFTCLIPPEHTTVTTRCSFCVDQAAAAVALTPEELERLAGTGPEWSTGRWWRVLDTDGGLWIETSDEDEARRSMLPDHRLQRQWVTRINIEWRDA